MNYNDGVYQGGLNASVYPHGDGTWIKKQSSSYESYSGEWEHGLFHGYGKYTGVDGKLLSGRWHKGDIQAGWERHINPGAGSYNGTFKNNRRHGQGVFSWPNGDKYTGEFKDGDIIGEGERSGFNGYRYEGTVLYGSPHVYGMETYPGDRSYKGGFQYGERHGRGVMNYPCGSSYEGRWESDNMYGRGVFEKRNEPDGEVLWSFSGIFEYGRPTKGVVQDFVHNTKYEHVFPADSCCIWCCALTRMPRVLSVGG